MRSRINQYIITDFLKLLYQSYSWEDDLYCILCYKRIMLMLMGTSQDKVILT